MNTTTGPVMAVSFPGGKRVTATYKGTTIETDQPVKSGGEGSAPAPFDLFLASLATCAGYYVLEFCRGRGIPVEGIQLEQRLARDDQSKAITGIHQDIHLPDRFPEKYRGAVVRAARSCTVKKLWDQQVGVETRVAGGKS